MSKSAAAAPPVSSTRTATADREEYERRFARATDRVFAVQPMLELQRILIIPIDDQMVVRGVAGDRRWIPEDTTLVGKAAVDVIPAARALGDRLQDLLKENAPAIFLEQTRGDWLGGSEPMPGAPPATGQIVPLIEQGETVGLLYFVQDASVLVALQERNERQRREIYELRQRLGQLNMELALANAELRRLDDAKSQFVSAAAHELRNPLASLMGYIEMLREEDIATLSATQNQYLQNISRSANRLHQLTNNLLDITRLDSNRLELVMNTIDPLDLLEIALSEMQLLFDAKRQRVVVKAEPALPAIWCDRARALQILTNLLSNAHKYTREGGTITAQVSRQKGRPFLVFRIRDNGIGIPVEDQPHLFTRFHRAANATASDGSGAGLGLPITQSLVRLHGGKIWFESKEGKGTSFYITLPIAG